MINKIAILTSQEFFGAAEDALLLDAFTHADIDAAIVAWDDETVKWESFSLAIFRSCWNYHLRPIQFDVWLSHLESLGIEVWNSINVVRQNMDKRYLKFLEQHDVPIVPSIFFQESSPTLIADAVQQRGWPKVVIKPAISASAYKTEIMPAPYVETSDDLLHDIWQTSEVLIQPFIKEVQSIGEYSYMFIDNEFSHAVLKTPAADDFRVQGELGGTSKLVTPTDTEIENAHRVLNLLDADNHFARVDLIPHNDQLLVSEVELIDPEMFFRYRPESLHDFANAVLKVVL